ncbi:MAG: TIGR03032 family protein [Tildeniella torsiva UHER 1998/13D]|jgi:uncharacterized protein (TIGR03032 family)|nr:TIGR03032 family protein [Tildeniella torsiva UHER 1998/13D]
MSSLELTASPDLAGWLREQSLSVAFTTYQTNRLFFMGTTPDNRLALHERLFDKPMGLYAQGDRLYMSTRYQLWQFENCLELGTQQLGADRLYVPRLAYTTGDLNIHDVVLTHRSTEQLGAEHPDILFVNTDFSCLATLKPGYSFAPVWQPPFISKLAAEDRCHLNGLAMVEGQPAFVTACSTTDTAAGWRDHRVNGGVVMHVPSSEIVATGLSMPHSPRWYGGKLWLLNSGTGELGYLDDQQFVPITFCPGFVRGLAFFEHYAFVGLSKLRSRTFGGLLLEERLAKEGREPQCGLMVIDLTTGETAHWLHLDGVVEELFDVVTLPGVLQPKALGFQNEDIQRLVTFPGSNGIVTTKPTVKRPSQGAIAPVPGLPKEAWESPQPAPSPPQPLSSPTPLAVKFQRVFHLTPENLANYDAFTFPSLQKRWSHQPQRGELIGISAAVNGEMVGMAIAECLPDQRAELLSLFVAPACRQQGIGKRLVSHLEQSLVGQGCVEVELTYAVTPLTSAALEPLLHQHQWMPPQSVDGVSAARRSLKVLNQGQ